MYFRIQNRLKTLIDEHQSHLLCGGLKGLEKESLRVNSDGKIAQTAHPKKLGSALTNPFITTDYSEALLEFITPPFSETKDALAFMESLHTFTYQHLGDELLWGTSMPCIVEGESSIPIAQYGQSNIAKMKHIYRIGLGHRYGKNMQAIAGIHFNYSLPEDFWPAYQKIEGDRQSLQDFTSQSYFDMTRNLHRYGWLVLYLFGASPAICKSFLKNSSHHFDEYDRGTLYEPYGTSLRMSDIGYKNDSQSNINISYNNLETYVDKLMSATHTPFSDYQSIGIKDNKGHYQQLNTNLLQIENEYYSNVRPKQIASSGERPSLALKKRGVRYVELRSVDLGAFDTVGANEQQLYFLETFMIFCLLSDSPKFTTKEKISVDKNLTLVATKGRDPELLLQRNNEVVSLKTWGLEICREMTDVCNVLDAERTDKPYSSALNAQIKKLEHVELTPSARILHEMEKKQLPFFKFALEKSQEHQAYFKSKVLTPDQQQFLERSSEKSTQDQLEIEKNDYLSFDEFLDQYFTQT